MKKIRLYESQLAGGTQLLENYRKVIELEIGLVKEIKRRKREKKVSTALTGEYYFVNKVMAHYQKGLKYFPDNYEFILQYFNFIKLFPEHQNVARLLVKDLLAVSAAFVMSFLFSLYTNVIIAVILDFWWQKARGVSKSSLLLFQHRHASGSAKSSTHWSEQIS